MCRRIKHHTVKVEHKAVSLEILSVRPIAHGRNKQPVNKQPVNKQPINNLSTFSNLDCAGGGKVHM